MPAPHTSTAPAKPTLATAPPPQRSALTGDTQAASRTAEPNNTELLGFRHVRYPMHPRAPQTLTPEVEMEMPGTPPLEGLAALASMSSAALNRRRASQDAIAVPPAVRVETAGDRPEHASAARVLQRVARCYLARRERDRLTSAIGRPAQVRVMSVMNLEMLCDYRNVTSIYCIVRILKKPYGPFMFQFSSSRCSHVNLPTWNDEFFVPMISSRCEIVVTVVGVSTSGRLRFLGQSIAPLETGWEKKRTETTVPLGKWTFPVDEDLQGLHRFVTGNVCCAVTPLASRNSCMSGQFQMAPTIATARTSSFFGWPRRRNSLPLSTTSPQAVDLPQTPTAMRKEMVTRWGVLTDTHLHLFAHSTAKLVASLELSKLQLITSATLAKSDKCRREPGRLYALKIYCNDTMYSLFVTTYAQQLAWEFKIDLHRRQLLIP
jgi:hypothetical protein